MNARIFTLISSIHDSSHVLAYREQIVQNISSIIPQVDLQLSDDFSEYGKADLDLIYVATGGTEGVFVRLLQEHPEIANRPIVLLANEKNNSLAASIEILSYLNAHQMHGEIIHGSVEYMAYRISSMVRITDARRQMSGKRIGVIGQPSDWLIASPVDDAAIADKLGLEVVRVQMDELLQEIRKHDYPIAARKRIKTCPSDYFVGALEIYGAIKRIIKKYELSGLTIRCFDLLSTVRNTGCLALALLNQEGIPSSCEGDVPALLSMMIAQYLLGHTGFQANPARINPEKDELLFAHCTVPLNMVTDYHWDTHFESGIGVALHGELPTGECTLFKVSGDLKRYFAADATLERNQYEKDLCRTQVVMHCKGAAQYFLHNPIGNHHLVLNGKCAELLRAFMESL